MPTSAGPNIIETGLVLALDAADRNSYTSGSASWFDLSGGSNTGTLTNGPTFNVANGGGIQFDGVNDYISASTSISTNNTGTNFYCGIHATMTGDQKALYVNKVEIGKAEGTTFGIEAAHLSAPFPTAGRGIPISGFGSGVRYTATGVYIPSSTIMSRFYNGASKEINSARSPLNPP